MDHGGGYNQAPIARPIRSTYGWILEEVTYCLQRFVLVWHLILAMLMNAYLCFWQGEQLWYHQCFVQLLYQFLIWMLRFFRWYCFYNNLFNPIFRGCGEIGNILLVWCCGNSGSFSRWIFIVDSDQLISNHFWWKLGSYYF